VRAGGRVPADGTIEKGEAEIDESMITARPRLAIPLVIALSTAVAARNGILVKDRLALERMRTVTAVLLDKTGTLTEGRHAVTGVAGAEIDVDEVLRIAGGVEADSEHPVARAIVTAAQAKGAIGGPVMLREQSIDNPNSIQPDVGTWTSRGAAVLYPVLDSTILGAFALEDTIRP